MPGVGPKITQHSLDVDLNVKPKKHKQRSIPLRKRALIKDQVAELKEA